MIPFREIRLAPLPPTAEYTHDRADLNFELDIKPHISATFPLDKRRRLAIELSNPCVGTATSCRA